MPTELTIDDVEYRTGTLNAKMQFHIARRLAPVIAKIGAVQQNGVDNTVFEALAESIAGLSDKDCDYVIGVCLSVVQRKQGEHWVMAWNKQADQPQFADMNLSALMQLTFAVIQDQLGNFMPGQPQAGQVLMRPTIQ